MFLKVLTTGHVKGALSLIRVEPGSDSFRCCLFVSIGHSLFAHQSFTSPRQFRSNLLFSVDRLLSS